MSFMTAGSASNCFFSAAVKFALVGAAIGCERDQLAVGRPRPLGVVAARVGQFAILVRLAIELVDFEVVVEVPRVALLVARLPQLDFGPLFVDRRFIILRRGEQHLVAVRMNPRARRLAASRRHALEVARFEVHQVDLKKRIARLPLALKDELRTVLAEISLASAAAFERQLPSAR